MYINIGNYCLIGRWTFPRPLAKYPQSLFYILNTCSKFYQFVKKLKQLESKSWKYNASRTRSWNVCSILISIQQLISCWTRMSGGSELRIRGYWTSCMPMLPKDTEEKFLKSWMSLHIIGIVMNVFAFLSLSHIFLKLFHYDRVHDKTFWDPEWWSLLGNAGDKVIEFQDL